MTAEQLFKIVRTEKGQKIIDDLIRKKTLAAKLKASYFEFFKYFWGETSSEELVCNWHIEYLCNELQTVGEWVINRLPKEYDLIINVPPGSSKSTIATVLFHPWLWANDPTAQIISGSWSGTLSMKHSTDSRKVVKSTKFTELFGHFNINQDEDAKGFYRNNKGGFRLSTSVGSDIIGQHAHIILLDDILNPKGAKSDTIVESVNEWKNKTISSRKVDKENTPTVLIMQRLSKKDPTGDELKKRDGDDKKVRHICLPATDDFSVHPPELKERYIGGKLDPIRLNDNVLKEALTNLGSTEYAGQFGQAPRALEGNIILREWLQLVSYENLPLVIREQLSRDFVVDTTQKGGAENDPSGLLCYVVYKGYLFLLDYTVGTWNVPTLIKKVEDFVKTKGGPQSRVWVEPKAAGPNVVQTLQQESTLNIAEWKMETGDKVERVRSVEPFLEFKKVFLVIGPWTDAFVDECLDFPNGDHDEAVDTLVMACVNAFKRGKDSGYSFTEV